MFEGVDDNKIPKRQKSEYENYQRTKAKFEKLVEKNTEQYELYNNLYKNVSLSVDTLKTLIGVATLSKEAVEQFNSSEPTLLFAKGFVLNIFRNIGPENDLEEFLSELKEAADHFERIVK